MHDDRTDLPILDGQTTLQHTVMIVLLGEQHGPWSRPELIREVAGQDEKPGEVDLAINSLHGAGLLNLTGELVTLTRAAQRMDELLL